MFLKSIATVGRALSVVMLFAMPAFGVSAPTFTKDVLPILQENCQVCHRPVGANIMGMIAPMSLTTYSEVRPWAKSIAKQVESRAMPPWDASPEFHGIFKNERTLTDAEIDTLVQWVRGGAKRGAASDAPAPVKFDSEGGWAMGKPDLIVGFDEPLFVADSWEDRYVDVYASLTKEQMPETRWIQAMEFQPGSEAVHHIVIFTDDYRESMGIGVGMLGGMGPGTDLTVFPEGYGRKLQPETEFTFNMHYHKEPGPGTGLYDNSKIAFKFQDKPVQHEVSWGSVGTVAFRVPAYASNHEVKASETFARDTTLLALFPHMHLRGKAVQYTAFYPDGRKELLLDVPQYDFNWQTNYIYEEPKTLPKGTRLEVTMWYDNSEERAKIAGIDPSRSVGWGLPTTAEMMFGWIDYTDAAPQDLESD